MVAINCFLGWGAIYTAIWMGQAEWIAVSGFGFLSAIVGFYMHIGNKDLAHILKNSPEEPNP